MLYAMQYIRSFLFLIQMYLMMVVFGLLFCPFVMLNRKYSYLAVHIWCRWVRWTAAWMVGLKSEVRGFIPDHELIIAAKHQSFFDIILIVSETPRPKFIMKSSLRWAPVLGWYAKKIGCVPVERGKRSEAIQRMMSAVESGQLSAVEIGLMSSRRTKLFSSFSVTAIHTPSPRLRDNSKAQIWVSLSEP